MEATVETPKAAYRKKAVAIAEDVLSRLDDLRLTSGVYLTGDLKDELSDHEVTDVPYDVARKLSPQRLLKYMVAGCDVCGLGAFFLSWLHLYDNCEREAYDVLSPKGLDATHVYAGYCKITNRLRGAFDGANIYLIESAFEKFSVADDDDVDFAAVRRAVAFGKKYENKHDRLRAIAQNIVDNNGVFNPPPVECAGPQPDCTADYNEEDM